MNRFGIAERLLTSSGGESLLEVALMLPLLLGIIGYAVDYGYYFIAAANITSAAHISAQYSVLGYQTPAQTTPPPANPNGVVLSVAEQAISALTSLLNASATTSVQVCSQVNGMTGNVPNCTSYGPTAPSYTPNTDPEAPHFVLQRVDITYTVQPPVPMGFFNISLVPSMRFYRQVSMRLMN